MAGTNDLPSLHLEEADGWAALPLPPQHSSACLGAPSDRYDALLNLPGELLHGIRLREEAGDLLSREPCFNVHVAESAADYHRYIGSNLADPLERLRSIHSRHRYVEQYQSYLSSFLLKLSDTFRAVPRQQHGVAVGR